MFFFRNLIYIHAFQQLIERRICL